jgi:hypothetical protein
LNFANDFTFNIKGLRGANRGGDLKPNLSGSTDLGSAASAALTSGEDWLKPAHGVAAEEDVELPALTGGHAEVVIVTDANLNALTGVKVVVGHHVSGSFAGYIYKIRTKTGQTRVSCRFF